MTGAAMTGGPPSIRTRLAVLLGTLVLIVASVGLAGVLVLDRATSRVERLTLGMTPTNDANLETRLHLIEAANSARTWQLSQAEGDLASALSQCEQAQVSLAMVDVYLDDPRLAALTAAEESAIHAWCEPLRTLNTADSERVSTGPGPAADLADARGPLRANDAVSAWINTERTAARADVRQLRTGGLIVLAVLTAIAVAAAAIGSVRTMRWVQRPLAALVEVLETLRAGDTAARVDLDGGDEVQRVGKAVNALADESDRLRAVQAEIDRLRDQVHDTHQAIRGELEPDRVLQAAADGLGRMLGVQRVWIRELDEAGLGPIRVQWQADGLAPMTDPVLISAWPDEPVLDAGRPRHHDEPVAVADVGESGLTAIPTGRRLLTDTGARALVHSRVNGPERQLASIWLADCVVREFDRHEVSAIDSVSRELGQALAQSQLFVTQAQLVDRLQELDRQKDDFVSTVSHELRTPLGSIVGYVEALQDGDGGDLPEQASAMLDVIDRNAVRLSALIENLLTISRIEGQQPAPSVVVDADRVVAAVLVSLLPQASAGGVELVNDSPAGPARVLADPAGLERIAANLVSNAVKFTPAGGQVRVGLVEVGEQVRLTVADTGVGISEEDQAQLFTKFFRSSNAVSQAIPGTGLGLAIVRDLVEGYGGSITIRSALGRGTEVTVLLRRASAG